MYVCMYVCTYVCMFFYAVVCWRGSIKKRDAGRLDRLVRRAGAVVGTELDCLTSVTEKRTLSRLLTILDNDHHPLHRTFNRQRSIFSGRLLSLSQGGWSSLHESTSVCPPLLISLLYQLTVHPFTGYTSPLHRLNLLYSALFSLHYHTST